MSRKPFNKRYADRKHFERALVALAALCGVAFGTWAGVIRATQIAAKRPIIYETRYHDVQLTQPYLQIGFDDKTHAAGIELKDKSGKVWARIGQYDSKPCMLGTSSISDCSIDSFTDDAVVTR